MGPGGRWPQEFQRNFPWRGSEECHLPSRLEQLGLGPDDLRYVVLSHLHNDHAGCIEYFRKSRMLVHEDEFAAAVRAYALHDRTGPYIWQDTDHWIRQEHDWRLVTRDEGDLDLNDNVRILNWGSGHAHGMLGLHVSLPASGKIILTSDAVYCAANYGPPARLSGVFCDSIGYLRTIDRIRALAEQTSSQVWFGHDLEQFRMLTPSTTGWYE
jgi:glyoxylase-like metal-dependent hydrolase (beta-lactamase superfamily II)